jgi:hypothetical protein
MGDGIGYVYGGTRSLTSQETELVGQRKLRSVVLDALWRHRASASSVPLEVAPRAESVFRGCSWRQMTVVGGAGHGRSSPA